MARLWLIPNVYCRWRKRANLLRIQVLKKALMKTQSFMSIWWRMKRRQRSNWRSLKLIFPRAALLFNRHRSLWIGSHRGMNCRKNKIWFGCLGLNSHSRRMKRQDSWIRINYRCLSPGGSGETLLRSMNLRRLVSWSRRRSMLSINCLALSGAAKSPGRIRL